MAESEGVEPPAPFGVTVFKTARPNHWSNSPLWWGPMDSNHLSPKTTGLQPVATLQLRRTPMAEDRGIEPRSPEGESQVSNPVHYRSANLPQFVSYENGPRQGI